MDAAQLVERRNRFGPHDLAAVNATFGSIMRSVAPTMSPPLLTSATMRSAGAAVLVRRDAERPRPMAACGRLRHGHCRRRASRSRNRRALRRRGSVLLTKDRQLAATVSGIAPVVLLPGNGIDEAARALRIAVDIDWQYAPFTRCLVDNRRLEAAPPCSATRVPEAAYARHWRQRLTAAAPGRKRLAAPIFNGWTVLACIATHQSEPRWCHGLRLGVLKNRGDTPPIGPRFHPGQFQKGGPHHEA
jgi:hypothetical protein